MASMLITEALQQIKILTDRIQKKREFVIRYVTRNSRFIDPLSKDGGSEKVVASELQAIQDLEQNLVEVRYAIQNKNMGLTLTIEGITKTVTEWLIWRREVSEGLNSFQQRLAMSIHQARTAHEAEIKKAPAATAEGQTIKESNLIVCVNELQLSKDAEKTSTILGTLDGKLSVLNATTSIEV